MRKLPALFLIILFIFTACEQPQSPTYKYPEALTSTENCDILTSAEIDSIKARAQALQDIELLSNEIAILETSLGQIKIEFYAEQAPNHCKNFKRLIVSGFYDCTYFHRILQNFVIQGGDINTRDNSYSNDGSGNPGYTVDAEFNNIQHDLGIVSMARATNPNSAGSQFFICLSRSQTAQLDGSYTVFGHVVEGLDVVQEIARAEVTYNDNNEQSLPTERIFIQHAWMEEK